jgi:hypothetical protein
MAQRCAIETTTTSVNRWRNPTPPGLLSNDEVLALDQDALGRQAVRAAAIG